MGFCLSGCNIISLLGFLYFGLNFLVFNAQQKFYEFHIENPDSTRLAMLVASAVYLVLFGFTAYAIYRQKQKQRLTNKKKHMQSIHEHPKMLKTIHKDQGINKSANNQSPSKDEYKKLVEEE